MRDGRPPPLPAARADCRHALALARLRGATPYGRALAGACRARYLELRRRHGRHRFRPARPGGGGWAPACGKGVE